MHLQGELVVTSSWNHHEQALHLASLLLCRRSSFCNAYTSTAKPMLSIQRDCIRLGYTIHISPTIPQKPKVNGQNSNFLTPDACVNGT